MTTTPGRLILLDGYSHIYRSFYAIRELTNPRGEPVNALYAMCRFLFRVDQEFPHDFCAAVLDKGKSAKRLEVLPSYKGTRPPMPDPLRSQIPLIREWMTAWGWPMVEQEGQEADDLIAAIARAREGHETFILSHDKDLAQLVGQGVYMVIPGSKGSTIKLDPAGVEEKFGVPPEAIPDFLALVGDSVDNIPGVPGVGPKTAASLLNQFGSIDSMLGDLDAIERLSLRESIAASADVLRRNQELVALDATLPPGWEGVSTLRRREPDWDALFAIAQDHGFKSIVTALEKARFETRNPSLF